MTLWWVSPSPINDDAGGWTISYLLNDPLLLVLDGEQGRRWPTNCRLLGSVVNRRCQHGTPLILALVVGIRGWQDEARDGDTVVQGLVAKYRTACTAWKGGE